MSESLANPTSEGKRLKLTFRPSYWKEVDAESVSLPSPSDKKGVVNFPSASCFVPSIQEKKRGYKKKMIQNQHLLFKNIRTASHGKRCRKHDLVILQPPLQEL